MVEIVKVNQWYVGDDGESSPHTIVKHNDKLYAIEDLEWDAGPTQYTPETVDELIKSGEAFDVTNH